MLALSGQGSAGSVYRALDTQSGGYVALKLLLRGGDERSLARFEREAQLLSRIRGPHLAGYIAHGVDASGEKFLAVDWVEGEDLARVMRRRRLGLAEAVEIALQALEGLSALHERAVVHRDVKPSNLMLSNTELGGSEVTLIDLGVAHIQGDLSLTQEGTMVGTPHFMSPEQILGEENVTPAADVFSMGVLLFEMLTGVRAYTGHDVVEIVAKIALSDAPRIANVAPQLAPALCQIVDRALCRNPQDRFRDAAELRVALLACADDLGELVESKVRSTRPPTSSVVFGSPLSEADETAFNLRSPLVGGEAELALEQPLLASSAEKRVVTALFAHLPAEPQSHALFDELVRREGGRPHRLLSFAHVGVFGAERSLGDEAPCAARAALALAANVAPIRLAISTGRALTGEGEISGDAIERGARVLELRRDGEIGLDSGTAQLLRDGFDLQGANDDRCLVRERAEGRSQRETAFVGRGAELDQLRRVLDEAFLSASSNALLVLGPGGIGKTRLVEEALASVQADHKRANLLVARPSSMARFSAFATLFGALKRVAPGLRQTVIEEGRPLYSELTRLCASGLDYVNDSVLALDRLRDLFEAWITALARKAPLVFVLEDLHFADEPSLRLLFGAARNCKDVPFVLLGLGREEPTLPAAAALPRLVLGPLPVEEARMLAELALRRAPRPLDRIIERALGNPYVIGELCRFSRAGAELDTLPESVLALQQARLDALGPANKRYAALASVFGPVFWTDGVQRMLGEQPAAVRAEQLIAEGVVMRVETRAEAMPRPLSDSVELSFESELLRAAAYESLVDADRVEAHRRAAIWLESKSLAEPLVLGRHFELAQLPARALAHYCRACELSLFGNDFAAAVRCGELAFACGASGEVRGRLELVLAEAYRWQGQLEAARDAASRATSLLRQGSREWFFAMRERIAAHGRLGETTALPALIEALFAASVEPGAESAQVAALVPAIIHLLYAGELHAAQELAARLDSDAVDADSLLPFARARIYQLRAALRQHEGDLAAAVRNQQLARAEFREAKDQRAFALVTSNLAFTLMVLGQNDASEQLLREAVRLARRLSLATVEPLALQNLGAVRARLGFWNEAMELQSEALAAFEARKDPRLAGVSSVHLALAALKLGRLEEAEAFADRVIVSAFEPLRFAGYGAKSLLALERGQGERAVELARTANQLLDGLGSVEEFEVMARLALAESLHRCGEVQAALGSLQRSYARMLALAAKIANPQLQHGFLWSVPEHARVLELFGEVKPAV